MTQDPTTQWVTQLVQSNPPQSTVTIKINPASASTYSARLEPYKNFPTKFAPALQGVADYVTGTIIPRIFKNEGPGWQKLSNRSQRERLAAGYGADHPILIRSGDLYRELTSKSHPKHVEILTTGNNARIRVGGSSEKFVRNQLGDKFLNIPARPMLPTRLDPGDSARLQAIVREAVQEQMKNG